MEIFFIFLNTDAHKKKPFPQRNLRTHTHTQLYFSEGGNATDLVPFQFARVQTPGTSAS
jgi:hypothetical protein